MNSAKAHDSGRYLCAHQKYGSVAVENRQQFVSLPSAESASTSATLDAPQVSPLNYVHGDHPVGSAASNADLCSQSLVQFGTIPTTPRFAQCATRTLDEPHATVSG
jgi:hypothetical protein